MKMILFSLLAMLVVCVLAAPAHAFMITRGTDTLGHRLIYDPDFDITWYDFSNAPATWQNQVNWASGLSVTFGSTTYNDWRLPSSHNQDGSSPVSGYNVTGSEMGHLFYTELGNLGTIDTAGNPQTGYGLINTGYFNNLQNKLYWSSDSLSYPVIDWAFDFRTGGQDAGDYFNGRYGLAVRSGDMDIKKVKSA